MITQPEISLVVKALNNTNIQFSLFALGASDVDKEKLLEVPDSLLYSYSPDVDNSSLFRLFGLQGLNLPPRGHVDSINVKLDHRAVNALCSKTNAISGGSLSFPVLIQMSWSTLIISISKLKLLLMVSVILILLY